MSSPLISQNVNKLCVCSSFVFLTKNKVIYDFLVIKPQHTYEVCSTFNINSFEFMRQQDIYIAEDSFSCAKVTVIYKG